MPMRCLALLVLLLVACESFAQELRAGASKIDITPPTGIPLWGYASRRDKASEGVRDPLHARAVVLELGTKVAIVALDLGRPPSRAGYETIAKALKDKGIDHLFLVASHTHHGPVLETETWPDPKKPYVRVLEQKIIQVVLEAASKATPARLGIARNEEAFNRNRHSKRADKPVDRELIVVRIDDAATGKAIVHLVNLAAHPTMLPASLREFSADYPGVMAGIVERERGGICLFLQGASGDLSPDPKHGNTPDLFGKSLAAAVLDRSKDIAAEKSLEGGWKIQGRDFNFKSRVDLKNPLIHAAYSLAFFPELVDFYEREYREGIRPRSTVALLDGRIGIVGVSGEFFSGHALSLKKRARLEHLLFFGYCNDYHQYFPTIEAVAEGGYGADALVAPVEVGAGERVMDQALMDLYRMRGKLK